MKNKTIKALLKLHAKQIEILSMINGDGSEADELIIEQYCDYTKQQLTIVSPAENDKFLQDIFGKSQEVAHD